MWLNITLDGYVVEISFPPKNSGLAHRDLTTGAKYENAADFNF